MNRWGLVWPAQVLLLLVVGFFGVMAGCSLAVDGKSLTEGCPEGTKACDGECVGVTEPEFGCGRASCSPCALEHAVAGCTAAGECAVASCVGSWEDCDREALTGCEINIDNDVAHCGGCEQICETPLDGDAACANAACYVRACAEGTGDCNFDFDDGCEVDLRADSSHCGACGVSCAAGQVCDAGECAEP